MIDRIFSVVLTFAVLIGSTLAIGSEFISALSGSGHNVVVLPRVVITGSVQPDVIVAHHETNTSVR